EHARRAHPLASPKSKVQGRILTGASHVGLWTLDFGPERAERAMMTLVAFLQAQNCSNYVASWRHAATEPDFLTAAYYQRSAHPLGGGKFPLAFFDDRLAMPARYGDDLAAPVRHGIRVVKMDLVPLITARGLAPSRLGVGGTYSTTYYEP